MKGKIVIIQKEFLKIKNISKAFAGVQALENVNMTINRGEICCLAGENGSGKSTLIKVISGAYIQDSGEIEINGDSYKHLRPIDSIRKGIQVIYQDFSIFPNLIAAENIALNYNLAKNKRFVSWKNVYKVAREAIDKINVKINLKAKVEDLSVADKQLVAISRALLQNAKLIIMDEPTSALTQKEVESLFEVTKNLKEKGISILFVSHKLDEVFEVSEKIIILRNGKKVIEGNIDEFDRKKFVYYMTGREIEESYFEKKDGESKTLLKVEGLNQKGGFSDISFELHSGEILGITGLLGCGRTALAKALFGLDPADAGNIYVEGKKRKIKSVQDAIKCGIGYVPEDRLTEGLFFDQSIGRNIIISKIEKLLNKAKLIDKKEVSKEEQRWIDDLSIATPSPSLPVKVLSGGNQQRVVLAKWLCNRPIILILNGPTVGVDIGSKDDIHKILRDLANDGIGVIVISDDIPEVLHNCNRILIMKKGRITEEVAGKATSETELSEKLSYA